MSYKPKGQSMSNQLTISQIFDGLAKEHPNEVAIDTQNNQITYKELADKSNQLARYLIDYCEVNDFNSNNLIIALFFDRSVYEIIAMLAILKINASFLPLSVHYPKERTKIILEDAQPSIILTDQLFVARIKSQTASSKGVSEIIEIDDDLLTENYSKDTFNQTIDPNSRAYIIYTSGSTGIPKGVMLNHSGVVNMVSAQKKFFGLDNTARVLGFANTIFDASIWEIFGALLTGATYCLIKKDGIIPDVSLAGSINHLQITHLTLPPSILAQLPVQHFRSLKTLVVAGEAFPVELQKKWCHSDNNFQLFNAYGPTEATVCVSITEITKQHISENIGNSIDNINLFVLDENMQPVCEGAQGELCIAGPSLAMGYLNQPELTKKYFKTTNLFNNHDVRVYFTGDLVRYNGEHDITYIGRKDRQIKFHGYRIELSEIEIIARGFPAIIQTAVTQCRVDDRIELTLFFTCDHNHDDTIKLLKQHLSKTLPSYMLPTNYIAIDAFPLTNNGKIDYRHLEDSHAPQQNAILISAADNTAEKELLKICSELIQLESIDLSDNFFDIGGHSLLIGQAIFLIKDRLKVDITVGEFFEAETLGHLLSKITERLSQIKDSQLLDHKEAGNLPTISIDEKNRYQAFSLSPLQQSYYLGRSGFFELSDVSTNVYREFYTHNLDINLLEKSLNKLILRHDVLRLKITDANTQIILENTPYFKIKEHKIDSTNQQLLDLHLTTMRKRMSLEKLDSKTPPIIGAEVTTHQEGFIIHLTADALIMDGWSYYVFLSEWKQLYENLNHALPEINLSYRDYIAFEKDISACHQYQIDMEYWQERIKKMPFGPNLPLAVQPKEITRQCSKTLLHRVDKKMWHSITSLLKKSGVSDTLFLLHVFSEIIRIWSSSNHFVLCLTLFNRMPVDSTINNLLGVFTTLTLLEINFNNEPLNASMLDGALITQKQLFSDLNHRLYPGTEVQKLHRKYHNYAAIGTLTPVVFTSFLSANIKDDIGMFSYNNTNYTSTQTSQVWLDAKAYEDCGNLILEWDFLEELFPANMIDNMFYAFHNIIENIAKNTTLFESSAINQFDMIRPKLIKTPKQTTTPSSSQTLLHEGVALAAKKHPNNIALIYGDTQLTYAQLENVSNQLANSLIQQGSKPGDFIALAIERSPEQVIAMLAILKIGGVYIPLDQSLPQKRLEETFYQTRANHLLCSSNNKEYLSSTFVQTKVLPITLSNFDANNTTVLTTLNIDPDSLAYVIFTSGSTGIPKGVMISHASAVNTIHDINERYELNSKSKTLSVSRYNFDLSVYDIFGMFSCGGCVVLIDQKFEKDPEHWVNLLNRHHIDIWNSVPMLAQMLFQYCNANNIETSLSLFLLSGDWVPLSLPTQLHSCCINQNPMVVTLGGATEASIWSVLYEVDTINPAWKSVPYGYAMKNQTLNILDDNLKVCPDDVVGELHIGGIGLAKGYLNAPEKTKKSFVLDHHTQERLYKTGDLAVRKSNGLIELLGRKDSQIKLGGHRIELEEIQIHLLRQEEVERAHVFTLRDQNNIVEKIVAAVIPGSKEIEAHQTLNSLLREQLIDSLPEYMLPHFILALDEFPLTANAKVDEKALSYLIRSECAQTGEANHEAIIHPLQREIAELWGELLGKENNELLGDDFFAAGGNSLLLINLASKLNDYFNTSIPVTQLFKNRNLHQQCLLIEKNIKKMSGAVSV